MELTSISNQAYSPGAGVIPFLYSSEIFPQVLRGTERQIATMEEMNYVFGVATRRHVDYQIKEVAPWCFYHYILRQKGLRDLDPLLRYARNREDVDNGSNETTQN
ncbi:MAG: hypothetical protein Q9180_009525 [Flavoplaca navasiana]